MILSGQSIRKANIFKPFHERTKERDTTFGIGPAGYDVRLVLGDPMDDSYIHEQDGVIRRMLTPGDFILAATEEHFTMPDDVLGIVHDKSSWARRGITVQNTVIEPGWRGFLTLEIKNIGHDHVWLYNGVGIAQVVLHRTDEPVDAPYEGKYQDQEYGPQKAR